MGINEHHDGEDGLTADALAGPRRACGVCGRVLDFVVESGWKHPDSMADEDDHPAIPVAVGEVRVRGRCDLCQAEPVAAIAEAEPITVYGMTSDGAMEALSTYDAEWACCAVCARLVRKGRWEQLLNRSVLAMAAQTGGQVHDTMVAQLSSLHGQLRETLKPDLRPV